MSPRAGRCPGRAESDECIGGARGKGHPERAERSPDAAASRVREGGARHRNDAAGLRALQPGSPSAARAPLQGARARHGCRRRGRGAPARSGSAHGWAQRLRSPCTGRLGTCVRSTHLGTSTLTLIAKDPLDPSELREILTQPESERLEFKSQIRDPRFAAEQLASLANSGGGLLVIGVRQPAGAVGVANPVEEQRLVETGRRLVNPEPPTDISVVTLDGKKLVVVRVAGPEPPYIGPGGAVARRLRDGRQVAFSGPDFRAAFATRKSDQATIDELVILVGTLNSRIEEERELAAQERRAAERARSLRAQATNWLVGGLIGAILGIAPAAALKLG